MQFKDKCRFYLPIPFLLSNIPEHRKTVHNTLVMNILKGYFIIKYFSRRNALKKPCQILNLNSAKIVNAGRKKMQKMDGRTESQADAE